MKVLDFLLKTAFCLILLSNSKLSLLLSLDLAPECFRQTVGRLHESICLDVCACLGYVIRHSVPDNRCEALTLFLVILTDTVFQFRC